MVVIVIMGLLAAIAVPNIMGLVEKSREKVDLLKLFYLREALNKALVESESALYDGAGGNLQKIIDNLKTNAGVGMFVYEVKQGTAPNVQGHNGKINSGITIKELIGNEGTWYDALRESGFEGVADVVSFRNKTNNETGIAKDIEQNGSNRSTFTITPDGKYYRTYPNNPIFISKALTTGNCTGNYRLTMNVRWAGGDESSRSVDVALIPPGGNITNNAFKTDHEVCFSTVGDAGCKSFKFKCPAN